MKPTLSLSLGVSGHAGEGGYPGAAFPDLFPVFCGGTGAGIRLWC